MAKSVLDWIALVLLIIGGLLWGLTGIGVTGVLDSLGIVATIVYILVGIAALYTIYFLFKE
jgi:uncharacterized protein